jgi:hypothetical protein
MQLIETKLDRMSFREVIELNSGLTDNKVSYLLARNGSNRILIDNLSIWKMFMDKVTEMFYMFQIASISICKLILTKGFMKLKQPTLYLY